MNFFKKIGNNISLFFSKITLFYQKHIINVLKEKVLLKRIFFTLFMMMIFVIVGTLTLPGIKINNETLEGNNEFLGILNTIGGGGLRQFSLVSLGISPFITASIVMTFAQTKLIPPIQRLAQSGPLGRIKINYITHGLTFLFGIIQAIVIIQSLTNGQQSYATILPQFNTPVFIWFVLPFVLVAGTFFSVFISEQITHKGVGNGTSILILAGVLISLPNFFTSAYSSWIGSKTNEALFRGIIYFVLFILTFVVLMFIVSFFYQAERRIPIQHTGVGRSKNAKDLSYLPIKLNPAGVMPIIFASMIISFPMMIVNMVENFRPSSGTAWMKENFTLTKPIGLIIYSICTFVITIFLGLQQSRLDKIVEDFNKNSTYIPGIRPGEQTEDYLMSIILRLSIFSAFYLTILGSMQYFVIALGVNSSLTISGTTIMILVSVSIETIQQIEARYKTQNIFKNGLKAENIKKQYENVEFTQDYVSEENDENDNDLGGSVLW